MNRGTTILSALAVILALPLPGWAQVKELPKQTVTVTGTVETIDKSRRAVIDKSASSMTFVGPNGWKYSRRVVDPAVFNQVKTGDRVDITWSTDVNFAVQ